MRGSLDPRRVGIQREEREKGKRRDGLLGRHRLRRGLVFRFDIICCYDIRWVGSDDVDRVQGLSTAVKATRNEKRAATERLTTKRQPRGDNIPVVKACCLCAVELILLTIA